MYMCHYHKPWYYLLALFPPLSGVFEGYRMICPLSSEKTPTVPDGSFRQWLAGALSS